MRKWFLAVSLIIIAAGAVMATSYSLPDTGYQTAKKFFQGNPAVGKSVGYVSQSRTVEANLVQGDQVQLVMTQGLDWRTGLFEIDDASGLPIIWVGVNITDPQGKNITFLTTWTKMQMDIENPPLVYLDKNVTTDLSDYDGGIDPYANSANRSNYRPTSNSFSQVGGTVNLTGKYIFQVYGIMPSRNDPPSSLQVWKYVITITYPLTYMLPLGIIVAAAGLALAAYSILSKPKTRLRRALGNKR